MIEIVKIDILTDSDGDAVVYGEKSVRGYLQAVFLKDTDLDAGADLVLTTDSVAAGIPETLLNLTDDGADFQYYPRRLVQDAGGADLTGTAGGDRVPYLILGRPKLTVAQGGDVKSAVMYLVVEVS